MCFNRSCCIHCWYIIDTKCCFDQAFLFFKPVLAKFETLQSKVLPLRHHESDGKHAASWSRKKIGRKLVWNLKSTHNMYLKLSFLLPKDDRPHLNKLPSHLQFIQFPIFQLTIKQATEDIPGMVWWQRMNIWDDNGNICRKIISQSNYALYFLACTSPFERPIRISNEKLNNTSIINLLQTNPKCIKKNIHGIFLLKLHYFFSYRFVCWESAAIWF